MAALLSKESGISLIELIMVMIILSIAALYVGSRISPVDATVHAQAARMAADLRHTQNLAMTRGQSLVFDLLSSSSYQVTDTSGSAITDPSSGDPFSHTLSNGVSRTGSCVDIRFDSLGRPATVGGGLLASSCTYVLTGNTISSTITLTPVSGFVQVNP